MPCRVLILCSIDMIDVHTLSVHLSSMSKLTMALSSHFQSLSRIGAMFVVLFLVLLAALSMTSSKQEQESVVR